MDYMASLTGNRRTNAPVVNRTVGTVASKSDALRTAARWKSLADDSDYAYNANRRMTAIMTQRHGVHM